MKIAYLVNQYPKISHTFIRNEILALEQLGFEIDRYAIRGWDEQLTDEIDFAERDATTYLLKGGIWPLLWAALMTALTHPANFLVALGKSIKMARASEKSVLVHFAYLLEACLLNRMLRVAKTVHVHCHFGTNSAAVGMLCSVLGGVDFSFTVHGPEEFDRVGPLSLAAKGHAAKFIVAISSFGRSQLYRHLAFDDWQKVAIVHCGLGIEFLDVPYTPPATAHRLVSVGRLSEQKGQLALILACRLLKERGTSFHVQIVGDGELREEIEREITEGELQDKVELLGWCSGEEIRALLKDCRGFLLPSFAEGLPVVIMEAMALARPVLSTYIAGIPELVREGREGMLIPASDIEALADAMSRMLNLDAVELEKMGKSAKVRVQERHSAVTEAGKLAALFRAAISGQRA